MAEDIRSFLAENLLSTSEAAEILGVSRQRINNLVKSGKLSPVKQSSQGYIFLRGDVEALKARNDYNVYFRKPQFIELGDTADSMAYFKKHISELNKIDSIYVYFDPIDAAYDWFFLPIGQYYGKLQRVVTPHLVIRDITEQEMWLGGCNCGYLGEGPHGTESVLKELGLHEQQIKPVFSHRIVKYFFDQDSIDVITSDGLFEPSGSSQLGLMDDQAFLYFVDNHLVLLQGNTYRTDKVAILRRYRKFIPNPVEVIILTDEQAQHFSYRGPVDFGIPGLREQLYNTIIRDSSGRELWLRAPVSSQPLSRQESLRQVLQECGFQLAEPTLLGDLSSWLQSVVRRGNPNQPLFRITRK